MTADDLIRRITQYSPNSKAGLDREWSDGEKWFTEKMKQSGKRELDYCYAELVTDHINLKKAIFNKSQESLGNFFSKEVIE